MPALTVLITNWTLAERGGSVLYTRDLALELLAQGHRPVVFSPEPGDVGNELRAAGDEVGRESCREGVEAGV